MDSSTSESSEMKSDMSAKRRLQARIISKVRAPTVSESLLKPLIHLEEDDMGKIPNRLTIALLDHRIRTKESYQLDCCYGQDEGNDLMFSEEVKPLVPGVFQGHNATVIAYGANGSGKTYVLEGSYVNKGLATLAMEEILLTAEERGGSVAVSLYEIYHDHIYDMLDSKKPEVFALEDGKGNIQIKGLSQIPVKSVLEFQSLYCNEKKTHKQSHARITEIGQRRHKGLMVHISSGLNSNSSSIGKMHFVDFSGCEDLRREFAGLNLVEKNQNNKTLHAFHKVVQSLGVNEMHIPYRGSKLTRILQDSLAQGHKILMITCLNPIHCPGSISILNLASRTYESICGVHSNSSRKPNLTSSCLSSSKSSKYISRSVSKNSGPGCFSENKSNLSKSSLKGRNLFDEENCSTVCNKDEAPNSCLASTLQCSTLSTGIELLDSFSSLDFTPSKNVTQMRNSSEEGSFIECEETKTQLNDAETPPMSLRIQELSNNIKCIYSTLSEDLLKKDDVLLRGGYNKENLVLETPIMDRYHSLKGVLDISDLNSPFKTFSIQSSEMKKSLSRDYIKFLNSASKEELKEVKGIGEKRATSILQLRKQSPEHFKDLDDLRQIGLSVKQIKGIMKDVAANIFS